MREKWWLIVFIIILNLLVVLPSYGIEKNDAGVSILLDDKPIIFSIEAGVPFVDSNDKTQVPLRTVMEAYGCSVRWDEATNTAFLEKDAVTVAITIGKREMIVNGTAVNLASPATVVDSKIYLPIRPVLEAFGATVTWTENSLVVRSADDKKELSSGIAGKENEATADNFYFKDIYVDKQGNLIFDLGNGKVINAGNVTGQAGSRGSRGSDGVSIVDAKVNEEGNLLIGLSNGKMIDAGHIGSSDDGGSSNNKTFADYEVGTRFYLTYPTGEFDVPLDADDSGDPIIFHFTSVYYELTAKRDFEDCDAWEFTDRASGLFSEFLPYDVTVHIEGYTNPALAGWRFDMTLSTITYSGGYSYRLQIRDDGSFSLDYPQKDWHMPKPLCFGKIILFE